MTILEEALDSILHPADVPEDCHNHCDHYVTEGTCCECGDTRQMKQKGTPLTSEELDRLTR